MFIWLFTFFIGLVPLNIALGDMVHPPASVLVNGEILMSENACFKLIGKLEKDTTVIRNGKAVSIQERLESGVLSQVLKSYISSKKPGWKIFDCKSENPNDLYGIRLNEDGVIEALLFCKE